MGLPVDFNFNFKEKHNSTEQLSWQLSKTPKRKKDSETERQEIGYEMIQLKLTS